LYNRVVTKIFAVWDNYSQLLCKSGSGTDKTISLHYPLIGPTSFGGKVCMDRCSPNNNVFNKCNKALTRKVGNYFDKSMVTQGEAN
jgi:hypothetical protein